MPAYTAGAGEMVAIVDEHNRVTGQARRAVMRAGHLIHRACYILVFNGRGELFVQKRTPNKDIYPGYYEVAAGGVVLAGESYEESAVRELAEELGISAPPLSLPSTTSTMPVTTGSGGGSSPAATTVPCACNRKRLPTVFFCRWRKSWP